MYREIQKQEIKKNHIRIQRISPKHPLIDPVWSDKIGYVLLYISSDQADIEMDPALITDARLLCRMVLSEIATDILVSAKNDHCINHIDLFEMSEIQKRWEPFLSHFSNRHL